MTGVASYRSQWDSASQSSATLLLFGTLLLPSLLYRSAEQPQHFFKSVVDKISLYLEAGNSLSCSVCSTPSCVEQGWTWNAGRKEDPGWGSTSGVNWLESPIT